MQINPNNSKVIGGRYVLQQKIGEGAYGAVYKARDMITNKTKALKKLFIHDESEGIPSTTMREIGLLQEITHRYIVNLDGVICDEDTYLVFDFLQCDLYKYIKSSTFDQEETRIFMYQIIQGLDFCHKFSIIHRDLKTLNVLVNSNCTQDEISYKGKKVQLADFGLARTVQLPIKPLTHEIETLWYRAPEILLGTKEYSIGVDMWSAGCILAEFYLRKPLFTPSSEYEAIIKIFQMFGTPNESSWPGISQLRDFKNTFPKFKPMNDIFPLMDQQALDLFKKLMILDPQQRITTREALKHPYFSSVRKLERQIEGKYNECLKSRLPIIYEDNFEENKENYRP